MDEMEFENNAAFSYQDHHNQHPWQHAKDGYIINDKIICQLKLRCHFQLRCQDHL